jgi:hypothetical protein
MEGKRPYKSISKSYLAVPLLPESGYFAKVIDGLQEGTTGIYDEVDIIERNFAPLLAAAAGRVYRVEEFLQRKEEIRARTLP